LIFQQGVWHSKATPQADITVTTKKDCHYGAITS
jgi:hypothetical protein